MPTLWMVVLSARKSLVHYLVHLLVCFIVKQFSCQHHEKSVYEICLVAFSFQDLKIMEHCLQFNQISMVLLMTVCIAQATIMQNRFRKFALGQSIMGKTGAELQTRSLQECVLR